MSEAAKDLLLAIKGDRECNPGPEVYAELWNGGYIKLYGITWALTTKGEQVATEIVSCQLA